MQRDTLIRRHQVPFLPNDNRSTLCAGKRAVSGARHQRGQIGEPHPHAPKSSLPFARNNSVRVFPRSDLPASAFVVLSFESQWPNWMLRKYRHASDHPEVVKATKDMRIELYLWLGGIALQTIALLVWLFYR